MPQNKRESVIYTVLMCFCMVLWMSIYNVALQHGAINGEVIAAGARYTGTMAYLYLFAYMGEVIQGFFRGLGRLRLTMVASLLQVVLRVVLSYFLIPVWGMYGICVAVASGWVLLVLIEGSYSVRTARALTMEKRED